MRIKNRKLRVINSFFIALRPYHVAKNFLLFIPLFVGHHYFNYVTVKKNLLGFLIFCLLAFSAYLVNDLVDLEKDRLHPRKKKRPFASGELDIKIGFVFAPCLLLLALILTMRLPLNFILSVMAYYLLTLLYSFFIKRKKWLDIFLLAILYSLRVFSGMALVENGYSLWLIIFVLFLFFSLASLKRYIELYGVFFKKNKINTGRAYGSIDSKKLIYLGYISSFLAVVTFTCYIHSTKVFMLYKRPSLLWLICPCLIIWIKRLWFFAQEGKIHDDPVVFTVMDKFSWIILCLIVIVSLFAL